MYMVELAKFLDLSTFKKLIPKVYEIQSWYTILKQLSMKLRVHNLKGVEVSFSVCFYILSPIRRQMRRIICLGWHLLAYFYT